VIIQTRPTARHDGGVDFVGPCGLQKPCQSIGREGTVVEECDHYESRMGWCEAEITCKKGY
jgi:hypothetical protein